jgi:hypothetical protein
MLELDRPLELGPVTPGASLPVAVMNDNAAPEGQQQSDPRQNQPDNSLYPHHSPSPLVMPANTGTAYPAQHHTLYQSQPEAVYCRNNKDL